MSARHGGFFLDSFVVFQQCFQTHTGRICAYSRTPQEMGGGNCHRLSIRPTREAPNRTERPKEALRRNIGSFSARSIRIRRYAVVWASEPSWPRPLASTIPQLGDLCGQSLPNRVRCREERLGTPTIIARNNAGGCKTSVEPNDNQLGRPSG